MVFFTFPEDARWNPDRKAVEFSVILDPYEGTDRVPRRVFQGLLAAGERLSISAWGRSDEVDLGPAPVSPEEFAARLSGITRSV